MYTELDICFNLGKTYTEWLQLPKWERTLLFLYSLLKHEKEKYANDQAKKDSKPGKSSKSRSGVEHLSLKMVKRAR